jgi:hypothetical protein
MLSLDQVHSLEARVEKALAYIDELTDENAALRERLGGYEMRVKDLEILVRDFQQDQGRIEEGILSALEKLNAFEDSESLGTESEGVGKKTPSQVKRDSRKPEPSPQRAASPHGQSEVHEAVAAPPAAAVKPESAQMAKPAEDIVEIDESDEIIEEEEEELLPPPERKSSGELDIF